jgi:hypothetical protein
MSLKCDVDHLGELEKKATPEMLKRAERLKNIFAAIKEPGDEGKIMRFGFKLRESLGGNIDHDIIGWIRLNTGVDLTKSDGRSLTDGDLTMLETKIAKMRKLILRAGGKSTESGFKALVKKFWFMPHEHFERNIIGGKDLWAETSAEDARRNDRLESMSNQLLMLEESIGEIISVDAAKAGKDAAKYEGAFAAAQTKRQQIESSIKAGEKKFDQADLSKAKQEERYAAAEMKAFRAGTIGQNDAGKLFNDLMAALSGKYGDPQYAHRVLSEKWGSKVKSSRIKDTIKQTTDMLDRMGIIAKDAVEKARRTVELELIHDKGFSKKEAAEIAEKMVHWKEEEYYMPRQALLNAGMLREATSAIRGVDSKYETRQIVDAYIANSTKARKGDHEKAMNSKNMISVLKGYAEEIIYMDYHNSIGMLVNEHIAGMKNLKKKVNSAEWHAYTDATIREILSYAEEMTFSRDAGIGHNAIRTLVAMKASQTMGFWPLPNLSTPALNAAEGRLHALMKFGVHRFNEVRQRKQQYEGELGDILKGEYTKMAGTDLLGDRPHPTNYKALSALMTNAELKRYYDIDMTAYERLAEGAANNMSKLATKSLVLQREAENGNRRYAFESGAADEYHFIKQRFYHSFMSEHGEVPAWILRQYNINPNSMNSPEGRAAAWNKFAKARVTRAGYDFMYQTQWQYNYAARHFAEKWSPGGVPVGRALMMFQHYPLNWIASYRMNIEHISTVIGNSGLKQLFKPTTRDKMQKGKFGIGAKVSSDMLYMMSVGAAHLSNQVMRYKSPVVLGMLFSHPLYELLAESIDWLGGDEDERDKAFFGKGAVSQFLGPHYSDFTDHVMPAIGVAANSYLLDTGQLPEYFHDITKQGFGFDWSPEALEEWAAEGIWGQTANTVKEAFLWEAAGSYPKWKRVGNDVMNMDMNKLGWDLLKTTGIRPNWDAMHRAENKKDDERDRRRM